MDKKDRLLAALVVAALASVYWAGRCPSFGPGDSPQHVVSALTWGVSLPPGYPLYVMLGHLAGKLPLGTAAGNVNALSGLFHALAAGFLFLTLRLLGCRATASLTVTALMGFSPLFWYYSEVAEVRALNDLLASLSLYLAARWERDRRPGALASLGLCLGLGIGHHPTFPFVLPPVFLWLWLRGALPSGRRQAALLAVPALLGLALPYAALGVRLRCFPVASNLDEVGSWSDVLGLFLRVKTGGWASVAQRHRAAGGAWFDPKAFLMFTGWFLEACWTTLMLPGLVLLGLGARRLWKAGRRDLLALLASWTLAGAFGCILPGSQQFTHPDPDYLRAVVFRFFLLPIWGLFPLAAFGADFLLERVRPALGGLALAAYVAGPLAWRPVLLRSHEPLMDYARDILRSSGPSDLVVLGSDDAAFAMSYMDLIAGRTERRVFLVPSLFSYPPYARLLGRRHPDLRLPLDPQGALSTDWAEWTRLNPGRELFAESILARSLLRRCPASYPSGALVRLSCAPPPPGEAARQARRFLEECSLSRLDRWSVYTDTQEVYLLKADSAQLALYESALPEQEDRGLASRLRQRLAGF